MPCSSACATVTSASLAAVHSTWCTSPDSSSTPGMTLKQKLQIIFFVVFCLPGLAIVGYAVWLSAGAIQLTHSGASAAGVIVEYERQENLRRVGRRFCPVVEFTHGESAYRFTDDWCNKSQDKHPPGSQVGVVFNPDRASQARIHGFAELHGASVIIGVIGAIWLALGIALVVRVK